MAGWGPSDYRYTIHPPPVHGIAPARRGLRFSPEEYRHILLAVGALIAAFTLAFLGLFQGPPPSATSVLRVVLGATVAVVTGFLLHELAHKAVAQRYGAWAEFRSSRTGLIFAILTGLIGIVFAAPGAVYIAGPLSREENGRVSLAGPLTNFGIALAFLAAWFPLRAVLRSGAGIYLEGILYFTAYINLFLGGFNMIPIPPLDGSKVIAWNPGVWIAVLAAIGAVFVGVFILSA